MTNNLENKNQSAEHQLKGSEPIKLEGYGSIGQAKTETGIDQAISEKQKEEALKNKFLQDESEARGEQERGESVTTYSQYKLAIMEELLKNKVVDFPKIVRQLRDPNQSSNFDLSGCYDAFEMIRYYSNNPKELAGEYKTKRFMELSQDPAQYVEDIAKLINKISQQKQAIIKREAELGVPASKHDHYRLAILDKLLKENKVDVPKLAREMRQTEGDNFDLEAFKDAYLILDRETKADVRQASSAETASQTEKLAKEVIEKEQPPKEQFSQSAEELGSLELAPKEKTKLEEVEKVVIQEMPAQPTDEIPAKKTKGKIIAGFLYKTIASVTGVKSIIDWIGAGLGKLGLKIGQRTDVYKYFEQKKETAQDRGQLDGALEKLIEVAATNHESRQEIYQNQRYIDLVAEIDRLQASYNQEKDAEAKAVLAEEIKKDNEEKKKLAQQYEQAAERVGVRQELKKLAVDYNKLIDNARSADYYDLPKDQRQKLDDNWDKLSEIEKQPYVLPESDKRTMKIRLGQILIGNLDKKDTLVKRQGESIQGVLSDYIHGKVEASTLLKDGLNTAFTLTGAGVWRGLAYGTMAVAERSEVKDREFRKEYSWNKIGEKISGSRQLMDLFTSSIKETYYGLAGRRFSQKYTLDEGGKLKRSTEKNKLKGQESFALRLKALGEIIRLFGIGGQTVGAAINDGTSLESSLAAITSTFKGDVGQNMFNNWYDNFRLDQRVTKSLKVLQGRLGQENPVAIEAAMMTGIVTSESAMNIDLDNLEELDTDKIAWLAEQGQTVSTGGSVSEALGRSVSGQESMLLVSFDNHGAPIIYDGYDPNIIAPGARVIDYDGRLVAIDNDPNHLNFYEQHYFDGLSEQISENVAVDLNINDSLSVDEVSFGNNSANELVVEPSEEINYEEPIEYTEQPYFNLTTKGQIDYEDLAQGDSGVYQQFIMANRPGGLQGAGQNFNQDLGGDIDRIYHNRDLSVDDRIKILTGIKQEMNSPEMINKVANPDLRDHVAGIYQRYSNVIDHNIELLKHPDGTPIPEEWDGGLEEFIKWRDAGRPNNN